MLDVFNETGIERRKEKKDFKSIKYRKREEGFATENYSSGQIGR
jgi:hypothetical protein